MEMKLMYKTCVFLVAFTISTGDSLNCKYNHVMFKNVRLNVSSREKKYNNIKI